MTLSQPMILFALRYCLFSSSYAPETCAMYLIDHWAVFDPDFQAQIVAEIRKRLEAQTMDREIAKLWERMLIEVTLLDAQTQSEHSHESNSLVE